MGLPGLGTNRNGKSHTAVGRECRTPFTNSYFLRRFPTLHTVSTRLGPVSDYDDFYDARLTFNEDTSGPDLPGPARTRRHPAVLHHLQAACCRRHAREGSPWRQAGRQGGQSKERPGQQPAAETNDKAKRGLRPKNNVVKSWRLPLRPACKVLLVPLRAPTPPRSLYPFHSSPSSRLPPPPSHTDDRRSREAPPLKESPIHQAEPRAPATRSPKGWCRWTFTT